MVRMNTQGLKVPISIEEFKRIPQSIGAKTATLRKKYFSDFGPKNERVGSLQDEELNIDDDEDEIEEQRKTEEETTSVFDLVHRGRQRD
jgi:hypothetical protein